MGGAVEMCSGVGACRKKLDGTMCPSYMATREEAHSTRGRANVLRLAMTGRLGEAGLGDEGVHEVLDLCLECRACKAECPVGVDVARFKSEFLADYWQRHGTPLRARALGKIDRLSEWGSRFAPLSNWINAAAPAAGSTSAAWASTAGARCRRGSGETFEQWRRAQSATAAADAQAVTLFNDTFTNHYDPEIGIAALEVLRTRRMRGQRRAARLLRPAADLARAAGRGARTTRRRVVDGLLPIAERGEKILFCEPSCLSAVNEDAPSLLRGELQRKARTVADACMLFEEFAAKLDLPLRAGRRHDAAARPLSSEIDGTAAGHRGAALAHPERHGRRSRCRLLRHGGIVRLSPGALRSVEGDRRATPASGGQAMPPGDVLVAPGTSCRHQVADLSGTVAVHPAVLIRDLLM